MELRRAIPSEAFLTVTEDSEGDSPTNFTRGRSPATTRTPTFLKNRLQAESEPFRTIQSECRLDESRCHCCFELNVEATSCPHCSQTFCINCVCESQCHQCQGLEICPLDMKPKVLSDGEDDPGKKVRWHKHNENQSSNQWDKERNAIEILDPPKKPLRKSWLVRTKEEKKKGTEAIRKQKKKGSVIQLRSAYRNFDGEESDGEEEIPDKVKRKKVLNLKTIEEEVVQQNAHIEEVKDSIEELQREMDLKKKDLMHRELELSRLRWEMECCRGHPEDQASLLDYSQIVKVTSRWSKTDYASLKRALDRVKTAILHSRSCFGSDEQEQPENQDEGYGPYMSMQRNVTSLTDRAFIIACAAPLFDIHEYTPGNGYRSLLVVLESCMSNFETVITKKDRKWWKTLKKDGTAVTYLSTWSFVMNTAVEDVLYNSCAGCLFPAVDYDRVLPRLLALPLQVFYGTFFGVQYSSGLRQVLGLLLVAMASYSEGMKSGEGMKGKVRAVMTSTKYLAFNKKAAYRTVKLFNSGDIGFLRAFWELQEKVSFVEIDTAIRTPTPAVNIVFRVGVVPITLPNRNNPSIKVTIDVQQLFFQHNEQHHCEKHYQQQESLLQERELLSKGESGRTKNATCKVHFDRYLKRGIFTNVQLRLLSYRRHQGQGSGFVFENLTGATSPPDSPLSSPRSPSPFISNSRYPPSPPPIKTESPPESPKPKYRETLKPKKSSSIQPPSLPSASSSFLLAGSVPKPSYSAPLLPDQPSPPKSRHRKENPKKQEDSKEVYPSAPGLLIHFHGGGFVAQTSKAHLNYLRDYAKAIQAPILSVDYSLAPEAPFPQSLYEGFFTYCWAIDNCTLLGSRGEKIVLTGDSSGANLVFAIAMLAIKHGIRKPDAIIPVYPAILARQIPSPSRLLSVMDPLLGTGVLIQCLYCYSCGLEVFDEFISPSICCDEIMEQFPKLQLVVGKLDPLLDDSLYLVSHALRNNVPTILHMLEGMPHGFLGFNRMCRSSTKGVNVVIQHLRFAFGLERDPPFPWLNNLNFEPNGSRKESDDDGEGPAEIVVVISLFQKQRDEERENERGEKEKEKEKDEEMSDEESESMTTSSGVSGERTDPNSSQIFVSVDQTSPLPSGLCHIGYLKGHARKFTVCNDMSLQGDLSFQYRLVRRSVRLKDNSVVRAVGFKNLHTGKFISRGHFGDKVNAASWMYDHECLDIRSPNWKIFKNGLSDSCFFRLSKDGETLCIGDNEPLFFEMIPQ